VKITDKARKEILHISSISPSIRFEILYLVIEIYGRSYEGKEDGISHATIRYTKKKWNRVEAFKDCS